MSDFITRLNLRPQERRLLVIVLSITFVVVNAWLVWPHFNDWTRLQDELAKSRQRLEQYKAEIGRTTEHQTKLSKLEGSGAVVLPEEQINTLISRIQTQASQSRVIYTRVDPRNVRKPGTTSTNAFFEEQTVFVSFVNTGDKELLDFLLVLGSSDLMVRVRDLDVRPDPGTGSSRLIGSMTLVASYQKKQALAKPTSTSKKP